jgi:undecaprenyl-diphosphatase
VTYFGLAMLPAIGFGLWIAGRRRLGAAVLAAIVLSLGLTMVFQFLALRPRPDPSLSLIPTPNFPSFPSGHAAMSFAVAALLGARIKRPAGWVVCLGTAALIAFSRWYLGVHYPTDLIAGGMLGAAAGAGVYGLFYAPGTTLERLRWLLWLQLAVALLVTMMAYLDILPERLLAWEYSDKVFHFLLAGSMGFWLSLWPGKYDLVRGSVRVTLPLMIFVSLVAVEEALQEFSPVRSRDMTDFAADAAGLLFFWWLSTRITTSAPPPPRSDQLL